MDVCECWVWFGDGAAGGCCSSMVAVGTCQCGEHLVVVGEKSSPASKDSCGIQRSTMHLSPVVKGLDYNLQKGQSGHLSTLYQYYLICQNNKN